jgi:thiosulfate/3-mercaptopyruvate sulfurtransferase
MILALIGATMLSPALNGVTPAGQSSLHSEMLVSTSWLQQHLSDADLVVIYVGRDPAEYGGGHIPGERFLPLDELVEQHKDSLNDLPPVAELQAAFEALGIRATSRIVLCDGSGGLLAARAYFTLDYLGLAERASLLDGGMERWNAEGRPVDSHAVHPARTQLAPQVKEDVLVTTARVAEIAAGRSNGGTDVALLLDARSSAEFAGTVASEAVPQAGHLPGARSLYWKTLRNGDVAPILLDPAQLREAFVDAGATPDTTVVTYCRTGMQSSFTYFVAKYLGYRAAMYDGSVYAWVNQSGYDLVTTSQESKASAK